MKTDLKRELSEHKLSYTVLILFFLVSGFLFLAAWPDVAYQRYLIGLISFFYLFWGVIINIKRKRFNQQVFFEYLGVAFFAGILLMLITF